MKYRIWHSTESFADYIIAKTELKNKRYEKKKLYESDANNPKNFHSLPDHIKQILYLDAPDIIVELDSEPIFSIEVSTEAGTGHNAFQRFARIAASVENNVPSFYIYPEAVIVFRQASNNAKWDEINPLVFLALDEVMSIYEIPALLYYFPSDYQDFDAVSSPNISNKGLRFDSEIQYAGSPESSDPEMISLFSVLNELLKTVEKAGVIEGRKKLIKKREIRQKRLLMLKEFNNKNGHLRMSPLSATVKISTEYLLNYLEKHENEDYKIGELLRNREESIIYNIDAKFRGDPYPGALAAIDYLVCREGKTFEERKYNLVMIWGELLIDHENKTLRISGSKSTIHSFTDAVKLSESKNILTKNYSQLKNQEIPRYYMQVRYGSTFSKSKHIRVFAYFADAILFPDGSLWRDA